MEGVKLGSNFVIVKSKLPEVMASLFSMRYR